MTNVTSAAGTAGASDEAPHPGAEHSRVEFRTHPSRYRHWRLDVDSAVATLTMDVDEQGGLVPGYELKLNSYDLGVDIELYDAVQRLRFEHPEVKAVVVTSGKEKVFCAGANIRMLAASAHSWKVNFCKFTNETRNGIEDASENSGQTYVAALNGSAAGGGYELALACDRILLVDDRSSVVSLPELPLLGVLPGTGGLTRVVDKRHVRRDLADYFSTRSEGIGGKKAVQWKLVDEVVPRAGWEKGVSERVRASASSSARLPGGAPIELRYGRLGGIGRPYLQVADRGPGIEPRDVERIFEPFFTRAAEGTGLGLFLARELAQANRATLLYEARDGGGSIFRIVFADPGRWSEFYG